MVTRRQEGGDVGVHVWYVEEPTTKQTQLALECGLILDKKIPQAREVGVLQSCGIF